MRPNLWSRAPAVAGLFYPEEREETKSEVGRHLMGTGLPGQNQGHPKSKALGILVPHAGYRYSGAVAGAVYGRVELPERVILLGPNHTGDGPQFSLWARGEWRTPLGSVAIDEALTHALLARSKLLVEDPEAHRDEHCLEVQLPFLQAVRPGVLITPIVIGTRDPSALLRLGQDLADVIQANGENTLIIASSDMNHFENQKVTQRKDSMSLGKVNSLDPAGLLETVEEHGITMCGVAPTAVMLTAVNALGARKAELIRYQTSGDVTGTYDKVVGYAGVIVPAA